MTRFISNALGTALAAALLSAGAMAQDPAQKPQEGGKPPEAAKPAAPKAAAEKVTVVFLGNESCPADSKPIDRDKWAEVDGQRIYVCCDGCVAAVKKEGSAMLAKAYPSAKAVASKACACGSPVEAGKTTDVTWQGQKVALCGAECVTEFKRAPVTAIAMMSHPGLKDAKNAADPIDGKPVDPWVVVIYKKHVIHLGKFANVAAFEKDPEAAFAKLKVSG